MKPKKLGHLGMWARAMTRQEAIAFCTEIVRHHDITEAELTAVRPPKFSRGPCLGYDPRYQFAPGAVTFGAGFTAVGVGRDVDTGKGWR